MIKWRVIEKMLSETITHIYPMNQNVIIKKIKLHKRDYRLDQVQRDDGYCYASRKIVCVTEQR